VPDSAEPRGELWTRFREAVNLDALPPAAPKVRDAEANGARSLEELEIRRSAIKYATKKGLTIDDLRQLRGKRWKVPQGAYLHSGTRPGLVPATAEVFEQWAREDADLLTKLPINLVGPIEDLLRPARRPETPQPAASAEVAGRLVASRIFPMVRDQQRRAERGSWTRRLKRRLKRRAVRLGRWVT